MRRIAVFVLMLTLCAVPAAWSQAGPARGPAGSRPGMQNGVLRLAQRLNLTPDQQSQIRNLLQAQRQKVQSIRQDDSLTPEQKQDNIKQLRQSTHQQVLGMLTPDQQAKLKQFEQARKGLAALNLTPEQRDKIRPIRQQLRQDVMAVHQDASLTPEQKRDKIRDLRQNAMAQMKSVLNPEQQQQLEQMRQRRAQPGPPPAPEGF